MMNKYLTLIFVVCISCRSIDKSKVMNGLNSKDTDEVIVAAYEAGERRDTIFIKQLMYYLNDPRVTHILKHKGMSVFYIKTGALYKIHNIKPPTRSNYKIDSLVLQYWINKYPQYYVPYMLKSLNTLSGDFIY
ncbi:hypothetical protein CAP35_12930 [Chitinophagaceae bacterium IBVUCB1]|nr:hypothetical protein CAP35_12930 [Chitinophagaceae bacterium IBVUCB1]